MRRIILALAVCAAAPAGAQPAPDVPDALSTAPDFPAALSTAPDFPAALKTAQAPGVPATTNATPAPEVPATISAAAAPNLPAALDAALAADPSVAKAAADRDAAAENIPLARAKILPQVSAQAMVQKLDQTTVSNGTTFPFNGTARNTAIVLRQALYHPRDWAGLDVGNKQAEYGEFKYISAQSDLWYRTTGSWVDVLVAQALRDRYVQTLKSVVVSARQEKRRFEMGDGTRDAAAEAEAQLAFARAQLADASLDLQARIDAFNLLTRIGAKDFSAFRLPPPESLALLPEGKDSLLARAIDTNPEVAAARAVESINQARLRQASADHRPTLDLIGSVNRAANDSTNTLGVHYNNTMFGLQLQVPLYTGGGLNAAQRQAAANLASATADKETTVLRLKSQFTLDWSAQGGQRERLLAAWELVKAGREQRRAAELAIRSGIRTWVDLGSAELLLARRESDLVNLTGTLIKTQARLLSMLPATDAAWERWTADIARLARR